MISNGMENKKRGFWERLTGSVHVEEEYEEPKRGSMGARKENGK